MGWGSSHGFPRRLAVRRLPGQAARHAARLLHRLAALAVALAVLGGTAVGMLAWRLAQGPLELPWLTERVAAALNQGAMNGRITIGSAALAWEGFRLGVGRSMDIRLTAFTFADATGRPILTVPRAEVSLSFHGLLLGRTTLRALEIDQAHVTLVRAADGSILSTPLSTPPSAPGSSEPGADVLTAAQPGAGAPSAAQPGAGEPGAGEPGTGEVGTTAATAADAARLLALLNDLAQPPANDQSATRIGPFSQLLRLSIHDASLVVVDRQLGATWRVPHADIDLTRGARGGVDGTADLSLALGDQQTRLSAVATLPPGKGPIRLRLRLTPVSPAALARLVPHDAPLGGFAATFGAFDAPVNGEADLQLDDAMRPVGLHLALHAGGGNIHVADGVLPITGATAVADATPDHAELRGLRLTVPTHPGGADSVVQATGRLDRRADHLDASLALDLDDVDFADLPRVWPAEIAPDARAWVTGNITAGVAHGGHAEIGMAATSDFSDVTLTSATATLPGNGLVVHWLRPVPPIANGSAVLNLLDPDTLEIVVRSGDQLHETGAAATGIATAGGTGLSLRSGKVRITGLMHRDQFASIEAQIAGTVPDAIALLRDPRLQLLDKHPLPLSDPAGTMAGTLIMSFPLEKHLRMDEVAIRAHAHLDGAHLGGVIAGRDLDQGAFDLDVTDNGLTLNGTAALAGIPANLNASMDFRSGGPTQVLQRIGMSGRPSARQLAAAGLDASAVVDGTLGLDATLIERRDGSGDIAVTADLTPATMAVTALEWRKPSGAAMTASGRLVLSHDRLTGIENLQLSGGGASATGSVTCVDGKPSVVRLDRLVLGRTEASGTVRLPVSATVSAIGQGDAAGPIAVSLSGTTLDLSARLTRKPMPRATRRKPEPPSGPHWTLDARFDRVVMAGDHQITALAVQMDSDGGLMRRLEMDGLTGPQAPFSVRIASASGSLQGAVQGKRTLTMSAADAGELLAGLDLEKRMVGGRLSVTGSYDDTVPDHPFAGTAEIADFRIRDAPVLAHLLQAMTLYGLVEVVRGPGLGFSKMVAPLRLTDDTLTLTDARAFSASLGLTARGTIDLELGRVALEGTIVPAYFFNTLLGNIPLVGRLFSPEQGGGLFAASYAVHGTLDDPDVTVNPLAALTPGFLRGLFGLF
jgi:hypothetical protein